jgi:hypothetical protein
MSSFTASRLGQTNGAGSATSLFLKVFANEVLTALYTKNTTQDKHLVRTIEHGVSAQFPVSGKGTASYHTPGTELTGSTISHAERVITIDDKLVADRFIADIDEAMNHYDVRSMYSKDIGEALARKWDINVLNTILLAARASATVTGENGGTVVTSATSRTSGQALREAIYSLIAQMEAKDVDTSDAYCFVRPTQYYLLIDDPKLTNRDYSTGNGGIDTGVVFRVGGIVLVKSNNVPQTDMSADATLATKYQVNASTSTCVVAKPEAVGTVKLMDLALEMERSVRHQGTLAVGSYAMGSGILRPEFAGEIKVS